MEGESRWEYNETCEIYIIYINNKKIKSLSYINITLVVGRKNMSIPMMYNIINTDFKATVRPLV